jgi:hypothetical protein
MTDSLAKPSPLTRALDSIDRGHAKAADRLHTIRNDVRAALERGLDRLEARIQTLRGQLARVDQRTADGIIRVQGVAGGAIEKLRHARSEHVTS